MKYHVTLLVPSPQGIQEASHIIEADRLEVGEDGTLVFIRHAKTDHEAAIVVAAVKQYSFCKHDDIVPRVAVPPR